MIVFSDDACHVSIEKIPKLHLHYENCSASWTSFRSRLTVTTCYSVSLRIQSECGKIRTRKNSVFEHFSRSDLHQLEFIDRSRYDKVFSRRLTFFNVVWFRKVHKRPDNNCPPFRQTFCNRITYLLLSFFSFYWNR